MIYVGVSLFLLVLLACVLLNLLTLPGNWLAAGLVVLWALFGPERAGPLTLGFFVLFFGLAVLGEVVELVSQIWGGKKYGSSNRSTLFGIIGAIVGAIVAAPLFFGLGAIAGALGGGWLGSFLSERLLEGRDVSSSITAANGALLGRFLGMVVKLGLGIAMIALTAARIWPA